MSDEPDLPAFDDPDTGRRNKLIAGGVVAVAVLGLGGFALVSGGGSTSSTTAGAVPRGRAAAGASVSATPEAPLPVLRGAIGHDPFEVPPAVAAAAAPPAAAAAPAGPALSPAGPALGPASPALNPGSAGSSPAAAVPTGAPTEVAVVPVGALPSGSLPLSAPAQGPSTLVSAPGAVGAGRTSSAPSYSSLQLLAAHHVGSTWTVDVRVGAATIKGVPPGGGLIAASPFTYVGESELTGGRTFTFAVGEGTYDLIPSAVLEPGSLKPGKSELVAVGSDNVDGGL